MPPNNVDQVPTAHSLSNTKQEKKKLVLRIDDKLYDLTAWKTQHPGGVTILEELNGGDATDVFYSLHSKAAIARLKNMYSSTVPDKDTPKVSQNFRKLRAKLQQEGWFERSPFWEVFYPAAILFLVIMGVMVAPDYPILAIILIGTALEQCGWLGHDYVHGREGLTYPLGVFTGCTLGGFSRSWWSRKHNKHHAFPNTLGVDDDIALDPVFHLWLPDPEKDVANRRFQFLYFLPVYSLLYASWRYQSLVFTWEKKMWGEFSLLCLSYVWMFSCLQWWVVIGAILFGGFLVAVVVTASHQSEELIHRNETYNFITAQFRSTRDAHSDNPFMNYLWGGMQYQLEHHLFPTMPRYYYGKLVPKIAQFAKQNGLEYKTDSMAGILVRNFKTMYKYSQPLTIKKTH